MDRQLVDYLPEVMKAFEELRQIMQTEQVSIENLWNDMESLLQEAFVQSEGKTGAAIWEKTLQIAPKDTDSLELRNFRIIGRLNEDLPYTQRTLRRQLQALCGETGFTMDLNNDTYTLTVRVALASKQLKTEVYSLVDRESPSNLILDIELLYNTHFVLTAFTHGQLGNYTHEQLREEPL